MNTKHSMQRYLKKHTEGLVKDVGIENACKISGKSKATLGRYYSDHDEHAERFMPIDTVAELELEADFPHVTTALAEVIGCTLSRKTTENSETDIRTVNSDVIELSQRFATLMAEYNQSIQDGIITLNEAKRLLKETVALQQILVEMKLHLEDEAGSI